MIWTPATYIYIIYLTLKFILPDLDGGKLWQNDFQSFCFLNKLRIIYGLALQKTSDWSLWKHTFKLFFSGYNYDSEIIYSTDNK
jgi:hypothetical protein